MSLSNLFKFIAFRHLTARPSRSLLTLAGVSFGMSLFVAISIINTSTKDSMRESVEAVAGKAKLTISAGITGFPESKLESIRTAPGVKHAVPMVEARAFMLEGGNRTLGLQILGVDLLQETSVRSYQATDQRIIDDPLIFLNQPDSIVLTLAQAKKHNIAIGDRIQLSTLRGIQTFTVRGLLEPSGAAKSYGGALAIMDIDGARVMFGKENKLDRVDIVPEKSHADEKGLIELTETLRALLGPGYEVQRPSAQAEQTERMIASYQMMLTFFSTLALLVGLFLVMNSISVAIAERRREIGTLRALGATKIDMVALFVGEIFWVGFLGSALGCLIGRGLADLISNQVVHSITAQTQTLIVLAELKFKPEQFIFAVAAGTFASLFAALIPAFNAARVHPLESMRNHSENSSNLAGKPTIPTPLIGASLLVLMAIMMRFQWVDYWRGFDLVSKAFSVLGSALFGPYLVFGMVRITRTIFKNPDLPIFHLAKENLLRSKKRTQANVMALMVGLFLVILISSVRVSFQGTIHRWLDQIFVSDLLVSSSGKLILGDVQPMNELAEEDLKKVPGIQAVEPGRGLSSRLIQMNQRGIKIALRAIDHYPKAFQYRNFPIVGADIAETAKKLYESDAPRLLATQSFLDRFKTKVGSFVDLDTPSGRIRFDIIGRVTDFASQNGVIQMSRSVYKKYWNDPQVTAFVAMIEPGYTFEQVQENISKHCGKKWNLVATSNQSFKTMMKAQIDQSFTYTHAVEAIALLVGMLGLLNTLLISVLERTREIGMLRAIGTTQNQIMKLIYFEATLQGLFGAIVAAILGSFVSKLFIDYNLTATLGWEVEYAFPKAAAFITLGTGIIVAAIAAVLPARRAAKLEITEALDYD